MKTQKPNRNRKIDLAKIAKSDGFPKLVCTLEGHGSYVVYTNGEVNMVYDPETGEKVHQYTPKDASPNFRHPIQSVPLTPVPVRNTGYAKRAQEKYYKY